MPMERNLAKEPSYFGEDDIEIFAQKLTTFDIVDDGKRFRMGFACADGCVRSLNLPTKCLDELIMTLPRMMTRALWVQYGDKSLRLVFPLGGALFELSSDRKTVIMALNTIDGFEVSFGLTGPKMRSFIEAARDAETEAFRLQ
jgi:hypothetical protein